MPKPARPNVTKATLTLNDDVLIAAKQRAIALKVPLSVYVEELIKADLSKPFVPRIIYGNEGGRFDNKGVKIDDQS